MSVTVIVPTYGNRESIFRLLDTLEAQSYKSFDVLLVYKEKQGRKEILDRIKSYRKLDVGIEVQKEGRFEEALNIAYSKADGDICINTDDDAHVNRDWIKDHVELHRKHKDVGMATGKVVEVGSSNISGLTMLLTRQKWRMNKHTIIDRPIDKKFKDYEMYIGRSGMLVDTGRRYPMIRTFKQHGVNMSWKMEALHGFKLKGYTKHGWGNEAVAALEAIDRGFSTVWFDRGLIYHPLQESLSRSASVVTMPRTLTAENVLFSYYVDRFSNYDISLSTLKLRTMIDDFISRLVTLNRNDGYALGYRLAEVAVREGWPPSKVRNALIKESEVVA